MKELYEYQKNNKMKTYACNVNVSVDYNWHET